MEDDGDASGSAGSKERLFIPYMRRCRDMSNDILGRWQGLFVGCFLAWLTHVAILLVGTACVVQRSPLKTYADGVLQATIASPIRRAAALSFDLLLILTATVCLLPISGVVYPPSVGQEIDCCERLYSFEQLISGLDGFARQPTWNQAIRESAKTFLPEVNQWTFFLVAISTASLLLMMRIVPEGRFGLSPGKRLLGIQTVRSTLRPCGMSRSLVRTILYWVDIPLFISPLPSAISIMLSPHLKRLGDHVADTIVIRADSIRMVS